MNKALTSTVLVTEIRETPNVAEADAEADTREEEVDVTGPFFAIITA